MNKPFAKVMATVLLATGMASSVEAAPLSDRAAIDRSYSALASQATRYGFEPIASPRDEMKVRSITRDRLNMTHVRMDQYYKGIPVFGDQLVTHFDRNGKLSFINGTFSPVYGLSLKPSVTPGQALNLAMADFSHELSTPATVKLVILAQEVESPVLAYHIVLTDIESDDPQARTYFIDAHTGEIALDFDSLHTAMEAGVGHSQYSGTVAIDVQAIEGGYGMTDENRGSLYTTDLAGGSSGDGTLVTSGDLEFGDGTPNDAATAAVDAYYGAQMTWDYYKNTYGRSGLRDDNRGNLSRVHYSIGYVNAFWDDGCFCMTYGDGDNYYSTALTSLDVAGHEMTHGLTSVTAGLVYAFQPGGLNESMSDIFGTAVEFYAQAQGAQTVGEYYIGEDIWTPGTAGDALRYMDDPRKDGYSIDHASRYVPVMDVHYSSGLSNNVFFLASEGGRNSTSGKTVTGIGRQKVEAIFYRALTEYMTPWTNWKRARQVTQQAASELYGQAESDAIGVAWDACGVR